MALLERRFRVGQKILVHLDADMVHRTDHVLVEQPADVPDRRILDVIVAKHRGPARGAGGRQHFFGLGEARRHRLFAPDVLAGLECCPRHFEVEAVGRGDRHDIDLWIGDDVAPVARRLAEAELRRLCRSEFHAGLAQVHQVDGRNVAEYRPHRIPGQGMGLAHESGSDQADADAFH